MYLPYSSTDERHGRQRQHTLPAVGQRGGLWGVRGGESGGMSRRRGLLGRQRNLRVLEGMWSVHTELYGAHFARESFAEVGQHGGH